MKFGSVPVDRAAGSVLAHTLRVPGGRVLKKGRVLSGADAAALAAAGLREVTVATLEPDDVAEDAAAAAVAAVAAGAGVRADAASTGRCNLRATQRGLLRIDRARIDRLNLVDESMTLACLEPHALVEAGTMVATVKVIPFSVPSAVLERCLAICREEPALLRVAALRPRRAGLILTELPGTRGAVLDRAAASQRTRLAALDSTIAREIRCAHEPGRVAAAIRELADEGHDPILLLGASAMVDRGDVIPAALEAAGGRILHMGMPVDPGNLLLLGELGDTPVVGIPGCARSLRPSGFDWVLERLVAGVPVSREDVTAMGVGGLLQEAPGRPQPREGERPGSAPAGPQVGAIVLAAGQSRRMGARNKLCAEVEGKPMVAWVVDHVAAAGVGPVVVVTGHEAHAVREALAGRDVVFAHNPDFASGMSTSLRSGLEALEGPVDAALVCLGDMPWVLPEHIAAVLAAFDPRGERPICAPVHERKRGNPVLWPARYFPELLRLEGDRGARSLLDRHADEVTWVALDDDGVNLDADTPDALEALRACGLRAGRTEG